MERLAANVAQKQRAGKRPVFCVIPNALALQQDVADVLLRDAALSELLQNVRAPFNPSGRNHLSKCCQLHRLHVARSFTSTARTESPSGTSPCPAKSSFARWGGSLCSKGPSTNRSRPVARV